jgi:hypothetical protein
MMNGFHFNGGISTAMTNSASSATSATSAAMSSCNQCGEKRTILPYIFPTQGGKKEFCGEPCLSAYRNAQKGLPPSPAAAPEIKKSIEPQFSPSNSRSQVMPKEVELVK